MKLHLLSISLLLPASLVVASCARADISPDGQFEGAAAGAANTATDSVQIAAEARGLTAAAITEAPTGFDNRKLFSNCKRCERLYIYHISSDQQLIRPNCISIHYYQFYLWKCEWCDQFGNRYGWC